MKKIALHMISFIILASPAVASATVTDFANSDEAIIPAQLASEGTGCPTLRRQDMVTLAQSGEVKLDEQTWVTVSGSENNAKILANLIQGNKALALDEVFHCKKAVKKMVGDKAECTYEMCLNSHPAYDDMHYQVTITTK